MGYSLVEFDAQTLLAGMDAACQKHIDGNPEGDVSYEQERDVHVRGQEVVGDDEERAAAEYRHHGASLAHAEGQQLVMDMRLVGHEWIAVGANAVNVDAYDVEAWNQQGRHADDGTVGVTGRHADVADTDAHHAQKEADGKGACIAHENLTVFQGVAEHVEEEEGQQCAQRGGGQGRVCVQAVPETDNGVEYARHGTQSGGQAVDAVYQVHGVDDEDDEQGGDAYRHQIRHLVNAAETVQVLYAYSAGYDQERGQSLHHELGAVPHADKVIGHTRQIENYGGAAGETQRDHTAVQKLGHGLIAVHDAQSEQEQKCEQNGGEKSNAAQTWNLGLMYLARVRLVEEVLAEGNQQNLRDNDAGKQCNEKQDCNVDQEPDSHKFNS